MEEQEEQEKNEMKVLFQKDGALNSRTGELAEVVFQHFSKPFNFKDPKNTELLRAINDCRKKKFGDLKPAMEGDIRAFAKKEVFEFVFVVDKGIAFERGHYKNFDYSKWNPKKTNRLIDRKWKRLSEEETGIMRNVTSSLSASLTEIFKNSKLDLKNNCPVDFEQIVESVAKK